MKAVRKVTRHAETKFQELCAVEGFTCNPSIEDDKGWDFLLQLPAAKSLPLPLDMQPAGLSCFIQVKSNTGPVKGVRLKVSNALEFATSTLPCFIVLFLYSEDGSPRDDALILHFWEKEIARTLRRVREIENQGRDDLHSFILSISPRDMKSVTLIDIPATIRDELERFGPAYSEQKAELRKTVGFENPPVQGTMTFSNGIAISDIVDLHLGLRTELPVTDFTARSVRFGLEARKPLFSGSGTVSVQPTPKPCLLLIASEIAGREIALHGELYVPAWRGLAREHQKARFTATLVEIIFLPGKGTATFRSLWDDSREYGLAEMRDFIDLLYIFSKGSVDFTLRIDGERLLSGSTKTKPFDIDYEIDTYVRFLAEHTRLYDMPEGFKFSLTQMFKVWSQVQSHNSVIEAKSFNFEVRLEDNAAPSLFDRSGIVFDYLSVEVNGFTIFTINRRSCEFSVMDNGRLNVKCSAPISSYTRIFPGSVDETEAGLRTEIQRKADAYQDIPVVTFRTAQEGSE